VARKGSRVQNSKLAHVRHLKPANVQRCQFGICERATRSLKSLYGGICRVCSTAVAVVIERDGMLLLDWSLVGVARAKFKIGSWATTETFERATLPIWNL